MKNQQKEWDKCKKDFIYFCKNYIKINTMDNGLINFPIRKHQLSLLKSMNKNRFILGVLPRQCGKTLCSLAYALYQAEFHNKVVFLGDNKMEFIRYKFQILKSMFDCLPIWMRSLSERDNIVGKLSFKGGGKVIGASVGDYNGTRGTTIDIMILDEFAYIDDHRAKKFLDSMLPTLRSSNTSQCIIISTPNRKNHFHKMYKSAKKKEIPFKVFRKNIKQLGMDDQKISELRKILGNKTFDREYMSKFN